jgi:hypothetical protein
MMMWENRPCSICRDLISELIAIMADHLKAEKELADAMFISRDFTAARRANTKALLLLAKRDRLIQRYEDHRQATHLAAVTQPKVSEG